MQLAAQPSSSVASTPAASPSSVAVTPVTPLQVASGVTATPAGAATSSPATTATGATPPKASLAKKAVWQKQIPTLLGVAVLVVALVVGIFALGEGPGIFAPRATPQTTPKQVKITNVGDKSFSVSFYTDEATAGFVKYGTDPGDLKLQASDDRDQLAGSVGKYSLHHVTVKGLKANTNYSFTLGTGSGSSFDNEGAPFSVKTAVDPGTPPPAAKTVYGSVLSAGGTPAEGSVVYLAAQGGGELSALVKSSGSWAISLANARSADGSEYLAVTDTTPLTVFVQGATLTQTAQLTTIVSQAQPLADISLAAGGAGQTAQTISPAPTDEAEGTASPSGATTSLTATPSGAVASISSAAPTASSAGGLASSGLTGGLISSGSASRSSQLIASSSAQLSSPSAVLNLEALATAKPGTTTVVEAPKVVGVAAPKVKVKIEIHSDTEITQTVTADEEGNFELDVSQFQDLEPGEHTVTYSYVDPTTGQEITKTHTFTVEGKSGTGQLALAATGGAKSSSSSAYGSGNPYPITSPTKASTMAAQTTTRSAVVATDSGTYNSGSVGTTLALVVGGCFCLALGAWSWWLAGQVREELG